MDQTIRLLLVDDHALLRQGTAELLNREPDLEVVGEAEDGQQAIELAHSLNPDVVIMDIRLPKVSGVEATRRIHRELPQIQVLVLSAHEEDEYIFSLLQAGASGYLLKNAPVSALIEAIRQVHSGETPLDPAVMRKIIRRISSQADSGVGDEMVIEALTPREFEILILLAQGLTNRAIALELSISDRTVQAHLTNIFAKMGVSSRVEAVTKALRMGWLSLDT